MEYLGIFLMGAATGSLCMYLGRRQADKAAKMERDYAERRIARITEDRNAWMTAAENAKAQLKQAQIDQANSAGYVDGYNACRREMTEQENAEAAHSLIAQGLRDGKRVVCGVFSH